MNLQRACPDHRCACEEIEYRGYRGCRDWRIECPHGHVVDLRRFVLLDLETGQIQTVTHESPSWSGVTGNRSPTTQDVIFTDLHRQPHYATFRPRRRGCE